jgi:hypothetical protein
MRLHEYNDDMAKGFSKRCFTLAPAVAVACFIAIIGQALADPSTAVVDERASSEVYKPLCDAVTKRIRSAPDLLTMLETAQFVDGEVFTRPQWRPVDAMQHMSIVRALYISYQDPAASVGVPKQGAAEHETEWGKLKAIAIENIKRGRIKLDEASVVLDVGSSGLAGTRKAMVYRITESDDDVSLPAAFGVRNFTGSGWTYVVHKLEGFPKIDDALMNVGSWDLIMFRDIGYFVPTTPSSEGYYVGSAVASKWLLPREIGFTSVCAIRIH